jgi:hypothetical protein
MPIKVVNDSGAGYGTKLIDADTGEDLTHRLPIMYGARVVITGGSVVLECEVDTVQIEAVAGVVRWHIPGLADDIAEIRTREGKVIRIREDGVPEVA